MEYQPARARPRSVRKGTSRIGGALLALALGAAAGPQPPPGPLVELKLDAGSTLRDLLADFANRWTEPVLYDPRDAWLNTKFAAAFRVQVPEAQLRDAVAAILVFYDADLTAGAGVLFAHAFRNRVSLVAPAAVPNAPTDGREWLVTVLPRPDRATRDALANLARPAGRLTPLIDARTRRESHVLVWGPARTVRAMVRRADRAGNGGLRCGN